MKLKEKNRGWLYLGLFFLATYFSCKSENEFIDYLKTANNFVDALYKGDTTKAVSMIGVKPELIGEDEEHFFFKIKRTVLLLQKNEKPEQSSFIVKKIDKGGEDLIDIVVPVDSNTKIIIRFVKFLPSEKIAFFSLEGGSFNEKRILSPDVDNVLKQ